MAQPIQLSITKMQAFLIAKGFTCAPWDHGDRTEVYALADGGAAVLELFGRGEILDRAVLRVLAHPRRPDLIERAAMYLALIGGVAYGAAERPQMLTTWPALITRALAGETMVEQYHNVVLSWSFNPIRYRLVLQLDWLPDSTPTLSAYCLLYTSPSPRD